MADSRAPLPPELHGFEYVRPLGSGGFAEVGLYTQRLPRRQVAIKVLHRDILAELSEEQFAAEADAMAAISTHPHIVTIYQADIAPDGRPYLVMEYCPGANFGTRFRTKPFSVEEAVRDGIRLAGAVATAHSAGILHRDIKPANVLTNEYGAPALTDFGISSLIDAGGVVADSPTSTTTRSIATTATGTAGGTIGLSVPWSPPEAFSASPELDTRSDQYSLAATIYTLLAGFSPFERKDADNTPSALTVRIVAGEVTPLTRTDVPPLLAATLARAMSVDPAARFASVADFGRSLQRVELELGFQPTPMEMPNARVERGTFEPTVEGDETSIRIVPAAGAQPAAVAVGAEPKPRRRPSKGVLIGVGSALGVVLIAGAGFFGLRAAGVFDPPQPRPAAADLDLPKITFSDAVAAPTAGAMTAGANRSTLTFTFAAGDPTYTYAWQRVDDPGGRFQPASSGVAVVEGDLEGEVCIRVHAVNGMVWSENALDVCAPPAESFYGYFQPVDLLPGFCVNDTVPGAGYTIPRVSCESAHDSEVFHRVDLPEGPFPGDDAVYAQATAECDAAYAAYVGVPWSSSTLTFYSYTPVQPQWEGGNRRIVCILFDPFNPQLVGSVAGSGR